jgi:hypothetical protein
MQGLNHEQLNPTPTPFFPQTNKLKHKQTKQTNKQKQANKL